MKTTNPILFTAGALALLISAPSLGQSNETLSLNYERVTTQTQTGIEPDEIDARNTAALTGVEPDEIDNRATDAEPQAGLLLPAVQNLQAQGNAPQPLTPVFIEIDDIDGESTDPAESAPAGAAARVNRPDRATRPIPRRRD